MFAVMDDFVYHNAGIHVTLESETLGIHIGKKFGLKVAMHVF